MLNDLFTQRGKELLSSREIPWQVYPRPQMRRDSYFNLNGKWEFAVYNSGSATNKNSLIYKGEIVVPFCPESALSGVKKHFAEGSSLEYSRDFQLPEDFNRGKVLLHIGASDQTTEVFLNNQFVGRHEGGYTAFTFDLTEFLQEQNCLKIICRDNLNDQSFPYAKQVLPEKRGGMWYTPVSGIWQSVWLESVAENYIQNLHIENIKDGVRIKIEPELDGKVIVPGLAEQSEYELKNGEVSISLANPKYWSPEDPYLYDFTLKTAEDEVQSYFAIRYLEIKKIGEYPRLCLNGEPYFFHGLLDQGYWPDGIYTPAKPESYADDILAMKKLGFNTLRKHIKVEPEEFYYQCDKLGMVVFQDMVNNGDYSFWRNGILPNIGFMGMNDYKLNPDKEGRRRFLQAMEATVKQLRNHSCICYWTIFNEGWGQFESDQAYELMKKLDDTRFIDSTSGWFHGKKTDVDSRHVYFLKVKLKGDGERPLILSEFGGKTYACEKHVFNPDKSYGYGACKTLEELEEKVAALYWQEVIPCVAKGLSACIYTQVSDVEDEINGVLTYDREICKLKPKTMLPIAKALRIKNSNK